MATLVNEASVYLIGKGLVRDPRTAGALPPVWRQPAGGVPAPGEGANPTEVGSTAVVGLIRAIGVATPEHETEWRRDILDIWIRTLKWPQTEELYANIREAFLGLEFKKTNWMMGSMRIIESVEWRPLQLLDSDTAQGFTSQCAVFFQTYSSDHFG